MGLERSDRWRPVVSFDVEYRSEEMILLSAINHGPGTALGIEFVGTEEHSAITLYAGRRKVAATLGVGERLQLSCRTDRTLTYLSQPDGGESPLKAGTLKSTYSDPLGGRFESSANLFFDAADVPEPWTLRDLNIAVRLESASPSDALPH
jgi:hypothetical protein